MTTLKGICTPVCTVFTEDGSRIDEKAFKRHLDTLLEARIHIICAGGGTGEFSFLRDDERRQVLELVARHIKGKSKLIAHVSSVMTEQAIEFAKHAEDQGADALLLLPPYFEGPNLDGTFEHYERVSNAVSTPIMAYNIPVHTGIDLTPDFCLRLFQLPNVKYLKDSTADFTRLQDLVTAKIPVFVGGEPLMFHGLLAGAQGCFWGTSNAIPRSATKLNELVATENYQEAMSLWKQIYPLNRFVWGNPFNPSVKAATNLFGGDVRYCRRPVQPLDEAAQAQLDVLIRDLLSVKYVDPLPQEGPTKSEGPRTRLSGYA